MRPFAKVREEKRFCFDETAVGSQICANMLRDCYRCPKQPTSCNSWGQRRKGCLSLLYLLASRPAFITPPPPTQQARLLGSFLYYNRWQMAKRDQKKKIQRGPRLQLPAGKQAAEWSPHNSRHKATTTVTGTRVVESSVAHKVA